jgi:hypothetical protein
MHVWLDWGQDWVSVNQEMWANVSQCAVTQCWVFSITDRIMVYCVSMMIGQYCNVYIETVWVIPWTTSCGVKSEIDVSWFWPVVWGTTGPMQPGKMRIMLKFGSTFGMTLSLTNGLKVLTSSLTSFRFAYFFFQLQWREVWEVLHSPRNAKQAKEYCTSVVCDLELFSL